MTAKKDNLPKVSVAQKPKEEKKPSPIPTVSTTAKIEKVEKLETIEQEEVKASEESTKPEPQKVVIEDNGEVPVNETEMSDEAVKATVEEAKPLDLKPATAPSSKPKAKKFICVRNILNGTRSLKPGDEFKGSESQTKRLLDLGSIKEQ